MYDGVTWENIPADAEMVAGYIDGFYAWPAAAWRRFLRAILVRITVTASVHSTPQLRVHVLDVENGDATPGQAPGWAEEERAAGQVPTVYCNASTWPVARAAFAAARVTEPEWWIALYDGVADVPAGAVAKQYQGGVDAPYDLSAVAGYWPGVDPAPAPAPVEADHMMGQITGVKADIVFPPGARPASVRFGCSMAAKVAIDLRNGKPMVPLDLSDKGTEAVVVPDGCDMIVAHLTQVASDGTPVSWAY
jgi:hypothetical protein